MRWTLALTAVTAACGGGSGGTPDTVPVIDAFPTAPHTAYPQLPDLGGPRLAQPQLITVTFATDTRVATLESFAQWIVGSSWITTVGAEYGVAHGAVAGVAHRIDTPLATMTSGDIEAYLAAGVMDGSIPQPAAPATLADALYIIYYPSTTAITATFVNGIMKRSCSDFGGYHGEVHQGALNFAYAVIPDCGGRVLGLTVDETTELIASHEVIEAATTAPAWQLRPDPTDAWYSTFEFEVEVGDLCEAPSRFTREAGFVAQRSWSNAAAAAGGEPCLPIDPALPAFGVTASPAGARHVAPGGSVDFTLTGWSTGTTADWRLAPQLAGNPGIITTRTKISLSAPMINNGGTVTAHVTIPPAVASGTISSIFIISSHTPDDATMWPLSIDVQ
jgi:hypothetical protein